MFGGIKVHSNWRKQYNKKINAAAWRLYILSFVRISQLNWIGHLKMDSKRKVSKVFNNNPQGSRQRGRPKNRWQKCVKTDINKCKITNCKES